MSTFLHDFHLLSIYEIIAQKFQKYNTFSGKIFVELPVQKSRIFCTTSTFYTPLDAEDIVFICDKKVKVNIEKHTIALDRGSGEK